MTPLACLTRGDTSPRGKARVYFCCHPDDQSAFLKPVADQILALQNCAVWYDPEPGAPLSPDRREELAQMQLFVVPVTSRFLTAPSPALTEEFPLALEQHIPVLPLLQEPGLEAIFNEKCGDLQCLDPNQSDPTALPYAEKLKKFLDGVLVGDELAAQVRAAFDAYIFLSYRKKDRKEAQALMRLIHENEFCRDIAIWYDEFLTPGENFNAAITQALEKSGLFVLAVTPHLLEKPNYVMEEEFPRARDAGKPILPVEMGPTDRAGLEAAYPGIPPCAEAGTLPAGLKDALRGLALRENDTDPRHNFFIGLAYLAGIDVEVNKEKGANLIQSAARDGLPEAMEKLADMYRTGDGVKRDYEAAIQWFERAGAIREAEWQKSPSLDTFQKLARTLSGLYILSYDCKKLTIAEKAVRQILSACKQDWQRFRSPVAYRASILWRSELSSLLLAKGDVAGARVVLNQVIREGEELSMETDILRALYEKRGTISLSEGRFSAARSWFERSISLWEAEFSSLPTHGAVLSLSNLYGECSTACRESQDIAAAQNWLDKAISLLFSQLDLKQDVRTCRTLGHCLYEKGLLLQQTSDQNGALVCFKNSLRIAKDTANSYDEYDDKHFLALLYSQIGTWYLKQGQMESALAYYEKGLAICKRLSDKYSCLDAFQDLGGAHIDLGALYMAQGRFSEAHEQLNQSLSLCQYCVRLSPSSRYLFNLGSVRLQRGLLFASAKEYRLAKLELIEAEQCFLQLQASDSFLKTDESLHKTRLLLSRLPC